MKVGIALVVLGVVGLGQYVYFQLTPLAYNYTLYKSADGFIHVVTTRDWTVGLMGLLIGLLLLGIGVHRIRHQGVESAASGIRH